MTEYEAIREKAATQKRDVERALTRFIAKTGDTHSLFLTEDNSAFPCKPLFKFNHVDSLFYKGKSMAPQIIFILSVIACKPQFPSYLSALLPQDQIFDSDPEFQFEQTPPKKKKSEKVEETTEEKKKALEKAELERNEESSSQQDTIDNPYLRPGKVPKTKGSVTSNQTTPPSSRKPFESRS